MADVPPWYHESITAENATKILTKLKKPGAFLLRDSQSMTKAFTLSVLRSIDETQRLVDVKHYRITTKSKIRLKARKKKFPSIKELEKSLEEQERDTGEPIPSLTTPVQTSLIDQWDASDCNWRENYKVEESDMLHKAPQKPTESNKHASNLPRFRPREEIGEASKERDEHSESDDNEYEYIENSGQHERLADYQMANTMHDMVPREVNKNICTGHEDQTNHTQKTRHALSNAQVGPSKSPSKDDDRRHENLTSTRNNDKAGEGAISNIITNLAKNDDIYVTNRKVFASNTANQVMPGWNGSYMSPQQPISSTNDAVDMQETSDDDSGDDKQVKSTNKCGGTPSVYNDTAINGGPVNQPNMRIH